MNRQHKVIYKSYCTCTFRYEYTYMKIYELKLITFWTIGIYIKWWSVQDNNVGSNCPWSSWLKKVWRGNKKRKIKGIQPVIKDCTWGTVSFRRSWSLYQGPWSFRSDLNYKCADVVLWTCHIVMQALQRECLWKMDQHQLYKQQIPNARHE